MGQFTAGHGAPSAGKAETYYTAPPVIGLDRRKRSLGGADLGADIDEFRKEGEFQGLLEEVHAG